MATGNLVKRIQDVMRDDKGVNGDAQRIEQMTWIFFLKVYDAKEDQWEFEEDNYHSIIPDNLRWKNWAVDNKDGKALTGDDLLNFVNNELFPALKNLEIGIETPLKQRIVKYVFEDAHNYMKDGADLRTVINIIDEIDFSEYKERHEFGDIYETILKDLQSAGNAGEFYTPRAVTDFMVQMVKPQLGESVADFACGTGGFLTSTLKYLEPSKKSEDDVALYNKTIYGIEKKPMPYLLCITNMLIHDVDEPKIYYMNSLEKDVRDYTEDDKFDIILMNPPYGGHEKDAVKNNFPADLRSSETADLFMNVIMYRLKKNGRCAVVLPDGFLTGEDNAKIAIKTKLLNEFNLHTVIRMPESVFAPYTSINTNLLFFNNDGPTKTTWFYRFDMPEGYKHFSKTKPIDLRHFKELKEWWNHRTTIEKDGIFKAKEYSKDEMIDVYKLNLNLCGFPHDDEDILEPKKLLDDYNEKKTKLTNNILSCLKSVALLLDDKEIDFSTIEEPLNVQEDKLSKLEGNLALNIQKSILNDAVQGKLIKTSGEKPDKLWEELVKAKKAFGKIKPIKAESENKKPFEIPENWKWIKIDDLIFITTGAAFAKEVAKPEYMDGYTRVLRGGNVDRLKVSVKFDDLYIPSSLVSQQILIRKNDVITPAVTSIENIGKLGRAEQDMLDCTAGGFVYIFRPYLNNDLISKMVMYFLSSPIYAQMLKKITKKSGQAFYNMNKELLRNLWIPLPPLSDLKNMIKKIENVLKVTGF